MVNQLEKNANLLKAMAHPTRLGIILHLLDNGCNVTNMVEILGVPQATLSQHLTILKAQGIIRGKRTGSMICYDVIENKAKEIAKLIKD
jgi:DNA-binding transcriptional ArsR family regulator